MGVLRYIKALKRYLVDSDYRFLVNSGLGWYDRMEDEVYLQRRFEAVLKKPLNLQNPQTFNEKIQWLKLNDRRPEYTQMVDKYAVKDFIAQNVGQEYVIPTLGVWDRFEDIAFEKLPDQFVLKCTHDSGGLVICRNKAELNKKKAKKKITRSMKRNYYLHSREWPYKNVKPRIIAEMYMEDENEAQGLTDYKFFCFNGVPKMLYVSRGLECHATASISFYNMDGERMPFRRSDYAPIVGSLKMPENYSEMKVIAQRLAEFVGSPFVRIDLYSIKGRIYFSEVTFSPCGGMLPFDPEEWDRVCGSWMQLSCESE